MREVEAVQFERSSARRDAVIYLTTKRSEPVADRLCRDPEFRGASKQAGVLGSSSRHGEHACTRIFLLNAPSITVFLSPSH